MRRKILFFIIRAIVSISLIGFLLFNLGKKNLQNFPVYLQSASYPFLVISIVIFAVAVMLTAIRWKKLLEVQDIEFKFASLFKLTFIGFFFSNFLPGMVGGDAVKLYYTAKNTRKTAGSLASILLDRLLGLSALLIIATFAILFFFRVPEVKMIAPFVFSLFALFLIVVFLFFNLKSPSVLNRLFRIRLFDLGNKIKKFKNSLVIYRKRKNILAYTFFLSLIIRILIITVSYSISLFLNLHISATYFFLFFPIIQLITLLPITVGGVGTREWAFVFFFATVSGIITKTAAFALSITFYFVSLISSFPGCIAYLLMEGELKKVNN
jgi:uncharacterized protein (TIRG00374 family)